MNVETNFIWFLPSPQSSPVVLIKASSSVLKSIVQGAVVEFLFGVDTTKTTNYLCTGVKIQDSYDRPIFLCGIQSHQEEHQALKKILETRKARIFLFNELDMCVAWTELSLEDSNAAEVINLIGDFSRLYVGKVDGEGIHCLDCFSYTLVNSVDDEKVYKIPTMNLPINSGIWTHIDIIRVGSGGVGRFNLGDQDEGGSFEETVWSSLEDVFPMKIYKKPSVEDGKQERELTDILSFYKYGTFLIEAKALSCFTLKDGSLKRKSKNIRKDAQKAIKQLKGAVKKIKEKAIIKDQKNEILIFDRNLPPHCIILISDTSHIEDEPEIVNEMLAAAKKTNSFFHILDFSDFVMYVKGSQGRADLLDYYLIERFKAFGKAKTVNIRGKFN